MYEHDDRDGTFREAFGSDDEYGPSESTHVLFLAAEAARLRRSGMYFCGYYHEGHHYFLRAYVLVLAILLSDEALTFRIVEDDTDGPEIQATDFLVRTRDIAAPGAPQFRGRELQAA